MDRSTGAAVLRLVLALQLMASASLVVAAVIARIVWWRVPDWVVPTAIAACLLIGAGGWLWLRAPRPARWTAGAGSLLGTTAWTATYLALARSNEVSGWIVAGLGGIVGAITIALLFRSLSRRSSP